ncbi:glycosyltransferase family 4 protein [Blastococcus sp. KM273129]|uniref:glycosyltransferase family 4 protein n=1 Tax=Blastococcus sp. KM273129 TaxID=2570315 RepID=UPI001F30B95F|nr:glycosyltransferase family 4 protein [Blastococcus sp. KM273129]MCF6736939.1 glycosyltransferase [Blastococcus sp. KM273129]
MSARHSAPRATQVFAVARGQYDNIGDIVLRRQLLDWIRPAGDLHVYVGRSPAGYDEGLQLAPDDKVYRSLRTWYGAALSAALRGRAAYAFKPGEIQLTLIGMKEHLSLLPLLMALRLRRGAAVRAGVGTRDFAPLPRALMLPSILLSDVTLWRDDATARYMRRGGVMPDLAFGEGGGDADVASFRELAPERDVLVVSMRGDVDRPYPSRAWIRAVRGFAESNGWRITVVTQVRVDDERTGRLADDLGGEAIHWPPDTPHDLQEHRLREVYRRAAMVISDRLHVVIAAFTDGAVPVGSPVIPSDKVDRHLRTIGIEGATVDAGSDDEDEIARRLSALAARRTELFDHLLEARQRLSRHRGEIQQALGRSPGAPRPSVHHLGRVGDIAGGMTQVVNGYLEWRFPEVDVEVITSRGNPHDLRAAAVKGASALLRILRLPRRSSVLVAHLSGGGSFLREGVLLRVAHLRGLATVAHLHGSSFALFAARHPRLTAWVLGGADRVITLSGEATEVVQRAVPQSRVALIPNAIPGSRPSPKRNLVVFGGVVSYRKGIDVLQDAWEKIDAPDWELVVAGPVEDERLIRRDIRGLTFAGALPHEELMALLDQSRVAVLPSRQEAMPMFILESMARGNCVVSTDVGGIAAVLDGCGVVVPPADPDALRSALQDVISDADRRDDLARAARTAFEERFSSAAVFPRVEALWLAALAERRGASVRS